MEEPWEITCNRFVAFIDIMGFKNWVEKNSPIQIYEIMKEIYEELNSNTKLFEERGLLKVTYYSDSIIIFSKEDSMYNGGSYHTLLNYVSNISYALFRRGIPHKGAIAFGTMTVDLERAIFFGQPLIDAYLLHDDLNFYGIILHGTAEDKNQFNTGFSNYFLYEYLCPFKQGGVKHITVVPNGINMWKFGLGEDAFEEEAKKQLLNSMTKFRYSTSGHLRKYIDNTESYFQHLYNINLQCS